MTTYYVRKSGNDSSAGTGTGTAWLTVGKALGASGISSGDTVYVGAGIYRETITVALTNPTALTRVVADVSGGFTGDAGVVRITDYATDDKTTPSGTSALVAIAGRDYLRFENFFFHVGGSRTIIDALSTTQTKEMAFQDCTFLSSHTGSPHIIDWQGDTDVDTNTRFTRCRFFWLGTGSAINIQLPSPSSVDYDYDVGIDSCFFHSVSGGFGFSGHAIRIGGATGGGGSKPGGVRAVNCTAIVGGGFWYHRDSNTATISASQRCEAYNNVMICADTALTAGTSNQLTENYNHIFASTERSNVSTGGNSVSGVNYALLVNFGQEADAFRSQKAFFTPLIDSPWLGFGSATPTAGLSLPATDMLARPKPSGPGVTWSSAANGIGCLERHDFAVKETSTVDTAPACYKLTGPGDIEIHVPVDDVANVISVMVRWSSAYSGSKPQLILLDNSEIGVATETITASGSADTWEMLTLSSFTPTARGWVTLRFLSRSTAGTGITYWDSLSL